jgi:hypothetical protein
LCWSERRGNKDVRRGEGDERKEEGKYKENGMKRRRRVSMRLDL